MCCALWFSMLSFMCVSSCPRMCLILDLTFLDPSSILILPNGSTLFYSSTALSTDYVYFFIVLLISWWRVLRMCDVTYFPYIHPLHSLHLPMLLLLPMHYHTLGQLSLQTSVRQPVSPSARQSVNSWITILILPIFLIKSWKSSTQGNFTRWDSELWMNLL